MSLPRPALPEPGEVHLWLIRLALQPDLTEMLIDALAADERARASRLAIPLARARFIAARSQLRQLLAAYLSLPPTALAFSYGPHGKPELATAGGEGLSFNLSHSGDLALMAVNRDSPVGVDIERIKPGRPFLQLAERFFSQRERRELRSLPAAARESAFYACWTRKEAYLKAIGAGLATPLHAFDVTLAPGEPAALIGHRLTPAETGRWQLTDIAVPAGYRAALATTGRPAGIISRTWEQGGPRA